MADLRVVVSDPETGDSHQVEVTGNDVNAFRGLSIGDEVDGSKVGLGGYTLEITGGSDDTGRPMRGDVEGPGIAEVLVSGGTGFNPTHDGERKRVSVRGSEIGDAVVQVNTTVSERGSQSVEALLYGEEEEDEADETVESETEDGESETESEDSDEEADADAGEDEEDN